MVAFFCAWLRRFFTIDESRLRVRVYLHEGLDLDAAEQFWSEITGIPSAQFRAPYRAKPDPSIRRNKHEHGCVYVDYCVLADSPRGHGSGPGAAILGRHSGVAQSAEQAAC